MTTQPVQMINTELPDVVELKNIKQTYIQNGKENIVIDGLNLLIEDVPDKGEFIVILGSSGCGKTHILRYISGLQSPTSGEVLIGGRLRQNTDYVGMVFQQYSSLPHYTVLQNVAIGLEYRGVGKKERNEKAMAILQKVGLQDHANKFAQYPSLSGGQLQRVAIARSIAYDSKILLMDEPFGALDIETRGKMQELIADIWVSINPTIIMVTHAIDEAVYLGDRIFVMGGKPSNIIKEFKSPLPLVRNRIMKRDSSFIHTVQEIEDYMMVL